MSTNQQGEHDDGEEEDHHDEQEDTNKAAQCYQPLLRKKGRSVLQWKTEEQYQQGIRVIVRFLHRLSRRHCFTYTGKVTGCTCIKDGFSAVGSAWIPFVAKKLLAYQALDATSRAQQKMDAIRLTSSWFNINGKPCARMPITTMAIGKPTNPPPFAICKHAYFALLALKQATYARLRKSINSTNEQPVHQLKGKPSNHSLNDTLQGCLCVFFEDMIELGCPRATRFIRLEVGMEVRDCDDEMVELPSSFTQRSLYVRFCRELGFKASLKNDNGAYEYAIDDPANDDDMMGTIPEKPPAFSTFQAFWLRNYPHVVIPKAREDICNDCFVLSNSFRYFASHRSNKDDGECEKVNGYANREKAVELAGIHVDRARSQREYFRAISKDIDDQSDVLVMDFMQNLGVPYLGSEQAGATYYFSPLTLHCFGIVDMRTDKLHVYVYHEGQGKKGSNNVASMIWEYLRSHCMHCDSEGSPISKKRSLKIVMDNCSGQNKNKVVLRMALLLAEAGFYEHVEFVFLIVGHTKNPCDRMFNLLKLFYRRSNCYTFDQTLRTLNEHDDTTAEEFTDHRDWEAHLDKLYKNFDSGTIKKYHNFSVDFENRPNFMRIRITTRPEDNDDNLVIDKDFMFFGELNRGERQSLLKSLPDKLAPPGIPAIKQIELATKWRRYVPVELQDIICPEVSPGMLKKNREERSQKRKEKTDMMGTQRRKRQQQPATNETNIPASAAGGAAPPALPLAPMEEQHQQAPEEQEQQEEHMRLAWLAHQQQLRLAFQSTFPFVNRHY